MQISKAISNKQHLSVENMQHLTINDIMLPIWVKKHNKISQQCKKYAIPLHNNNKSLYITSLATKRVYEINFNLHYILRNMHDLIYCLQISYKPIQKLFVYNKKSNTLIFESISNRKERQQARRRKMKLMKKKNNVMMGQRELSQNDLSMLIKQEQQYFGEQLTIYKRYNNGTKVINQPQKQRQQYDNLGMIKLSSSNSQLLSLEYIYNNNNSKNNVNSNNKSNNNKNRNRDNKNVNMNIDSNNNDNESITIFQDNNQCQQIQQSQVLEKQQQISILSPDQKNKQKKPHHHHHYNPQQLFLLVNNNNKIGNYSQQQQQSVNSNSKIRKCQDNQQQLSQLLLQSQSSQQQQFNCKQIHQKRLSKLDKLTQQIKLKQYTNQTLFYQNKLKLFTFIHWQIPPIIFVISFIVRWYSMQQYQHNLGVFQTKFILENQFMLVDTQVVNQLMFLEGMDMDSIDRERKLTQVMLSDIKNNIQMIKQRQQSLFNKIVNTNQLINIWFKNQNNNNQNNNNIQNKSQNSFFYTTLQFQIMLEEYLNNKGYKRLFEQSYDIDSGNIQLQVENSVGSERFFNKIKHRYQQYVDLQDTNNYNDVQNSNNNNNNNTHYALFTKITTYEQQIYTFSKSFLTYFMIAVAIVAFSTAVLFVIVYVDLQYSIQKLVLKGLSVPNQYMRKIKRRLQQAMNILQNAKQQYPLKIYNKYKGYHHYNGIDDNLIPYTNQQNRQLQRQQQNDPMLQLTKAIQKILGKKSNFIPSLVINSDNNTTTMKSITTQVSKTNNNNNKNTCRRIQIAKIPSSPQAVISNNKKYHIKPYNTRYQIIKHYILPILVFVIMVGLCEFLLISFISSVIEQVQLIDNFTDGTQQLAKVTAMSNQIGIQMAIVIKGMGNQSNINQNVQQGFRQKLARYKQMDKFSMLEIISLSQEDYIKHTFSSVCRLFQYQQQQNLKTTTIPRQCIKTNNNNSLSYYQLISSNLKHYKAILNHFINQQQTQITNNINNNNNTNNINQQIKPNKINYHLHTIHNQQSLINTFTKQIINQSKQNYLILSKDPTRYLDFLILQMVVIIVLFNYYTLCRLYFKMKQLYKGVFSSCTLQQMKQIQWYRYFVNQAHVYKIAYACSHE